MNGGAQSQRCLKVGEEVKRCLSDIFLKHDWSSFGTPSAPVTITQVRMSPDLRYANVLMQPFLIDLKEQETRKLVDALNKIAPHFQRMLAREALRLKFLPKIRFIFDETSATVARLDALLADPRVQRDVLSEDE